MSENVTKQVTSITREIREQQNEHHSVVLWFTGLSGSGKSTLANATEQHLHDMGMRTYILDGDNVRHQLCGDLGFSNLDRIENIRRVSAVAAILVDAGVVCLATFISPTTEIREIARRSIPDGDFIEIFCDSSLAVCERRDTKGLYKRARDGEIANFTGISSPYHPPTKPDVLVDTGNQPLDVCVDQIITYLLNNNII